MNAARKLADNLRNLLPTNREAGRVRRKGEEPVDIELLRAMKVSIFVTIYLFCANVIAMLSSKTARRQQGNKMAMAVMSPSRKLEFWTIACQQDLLCLCCLLDTTMGFLVC